ncbi:cleavage polyadenylation factor subunit fip1 [Maudiozyma exigua]|uniref:Pre-mRNA polyadenylation factor FIP1 n=1 Tax=Maudiozyma exigua TaxID=34358 RepID=A0A9P6WAE3_MAUEX|nr:cleavage polyadenylation factor subunit fip1 [Kazachstania exigua]
MSDVDEDDKFLYGSDEDELEPTNPIVVTNDKKRGNEDLNIIGDDNNKKQKIDTFDSKLSGANESDIQQGESDNSDDESDWDIEIIVSKGKDPTRLDSDSIAASSATSTSGITSAIVPTTTTSTTGSISIATDTVNETESGKTAASAEDENELEDQAKASIDMAPGSLDIDKDGLYDGEPVTKIDPEVLKEKPWRRPGADISDYFNYGFNEYTWMEYLDRQEKWREEYNPRKILMGLLSLQQQGKLDPTPSNTNQSSIPSMPDMNRNNKPPQLMNPFPMFGGFPPFMPGMMPNMNPQQMQNQNNANKPPQQGSSSQLPPQQINKK